MQGKKWRLVFASLALVAFSLYLACMLFLDDLAGEPMAMFLIICFSFLLVFIILSISLLAELNSFFIKTSFFYFIYMNMFLFFYHFVVIKSLVEILVFMIFAIIMPTLTASSSTAKANTVSSESRESG